MNRTPVLIASPRAGQGKSVIVRQAVNGRGRPPGAIVDVELSRRLLLALMHEAARRGQTLDKTVSTCLMGADCRVQGQHLTVMADDCETDRIYRFACLQDLHVEDLVHRTLWTAMGLDWSEDVVARLEITDYDAIHDEQVGND